MLVSKCVIIYSCWEQRKFNPFFEGGCVIRQCKCMVCINLWILLYFFQNYVVMGRPHPDWFFFLCQIEISLIGYTVTHQSFRKNTLVRKCDLSASKYRMWYQLMNLILGFCCCKHQKMSSIKFI